MSNIEWLNASINTCNERIDMMKKYLQLKVDGQDWHGVADAAMDLRDLYNQRDAYTASLNKVSETDA